MTSHERELITYPATADRWNDLEHLFGKRGACGGCWCMVWRQSRAEMNASTGDTNREAFKTIVESGERPGVLAYIGSDPVAWCAVAPRPTYPALARSRILRPVDDQPVWSITCLFVAKPHRRHGLSHRLLRAAVDFAGARGASIVEGYPIEPRDGSKQADAFVWTGIASAFLAAGFQEVARRSPTRPIMRKYLISA